MKVVSQLGWQSVREEIFFPPVPYRKRDLKASKQAVSSAVNSGAIKAASVFAAPTISQQFSLGKSEVSLRGNLILHAISRILCDVANVVACCSNNL